MARAEWLGAFVRHSAKEKNDARQIAPDIFACCAGCRGVVFGTAQAQTPAPAPPHPRAKPDYTITGNFGIYSQYIFRGLTQTDQQARVPGRVRLRATVAASTSAPGARISAGCTTQASCNHGCSLEWDFYGGWKYAINDDWGTDIGLLYYYYPGSYVSGVTKPDTTEIYGAISWKWVSLKYSYSVDQHVRRARTPLDTLTCRRTTRSTMHGRSMPTSAARTTRGAPTGSATTSSTTPTGSSASPAAVNGCNIGAYYTRHQRQGCRLHDCRTATSARRPVRCSCRRRSDSPRHAHSSRGKQ